jgi:hypothetical protein
MHERDRRHRLALHFRHRPAFARAWQRILPLELCCRGRNASGSTESRVSQDAFSRYVLVFAGPVIDGARDFLAEKGHSAADVERMHATWRKSVLLTLTLWSRPYVKDGLW